MSKQPPPQTVDYKKHQNYTMIVLPFQPIHQRIGLLLEKYGSRTCRETLSKGSYNQLEIIPLMNFQCHCSKGSQHSKGDAFTLMKNVRAILRLKIKIYTINKFDLVVILFIRNLPLDWRKDGCDMFFILVIILTHVFVLF